jgi:hypothetical protein
MICTISISSDNLALKKVAGLAFFHTTFAIATNSIVWSQYQYFNRSSSQTMLGLTLPPYFFEQIAAWWQFL